jgi:CheY-like chemotaxis protein
VISCPRHLETLHRRAIADAVASSYGHALRNAIGAVGTASFRVRRRLEKSGALSADPELEGALDIIDKRMESATAVDKRFFEPAAEPRPVTELQGVLDDLVAALRLPPSVRLVASPACTSHVQGSAAELGLSLFCLVENASDALEAHGGGQIELRCVLRDGRAELSVTDEGPGLAGDRSQWFTPFVTTKAGHLGLGLTIVRRLAGRAGGSIALPERAGPGVTAVLTVPAVDAPPKVTSAPRVLLLDDDEASRLSLGGLLEDIGLDVVEASSLDEARSALSSGELALVLIDVYLRGEEGTDLIPEIRATHPEAKIAAVTGSATGDIEGADLVLVKGSSPAAMLEAIGKLLGGEIAARG